MDASCIHEQGAAPCIGNGVGARTSATLCNIGLQWTILLQISLMTLLIYMAVPYGLEQFARVKEACKRSCCARRQQLPECGAVSSDNEASASAHIEVASSMCRAASHDDEGSHSTHGDAASPEIMQLPASFTFVPWKPSLCGADNSEVNSPRISSWSGEHVSDRAGAMLILDAEVQRLMCRELFRWIVAMHITQPWLRCAVYGVRAQNQDSGSCAHG